MTVHFPLKPTCELSLACDPLLSAHGWNMMRLLLPCVPGLLLGRGFLCLDEFPMSDIRENRQNELLTCLFMLFLINTSVMYIL